MVKTTVYGVRCKFVQAGLWKYKDSIMNKNIGMVERMILIVAQHMSWRRHVVQFLN